MPSWATDFEKEALLQLLTLYNISGSWFSWFILLLQSALCLASHRKVLPQSFWCQAHRPKQRLLHLLQTQQDFSPAFWSCCLPSFSFCPLSMCIFIRYSANSISPPKINISNYWGFRFSILFTLFPPNLSRKENVNEQELNETHKSLENL